MKNSPQAPHYLETSAYPRTQVLLEKAGVLKGPYQRMSSDDARGVGASLEKIQNSEVT
jgi:hypothetical protein